MKTGIVELVTLCDHKFILSGEILTSVISVFADDTDSCPVKGDKHVIVYRATRSYRSEVISKKKTSLFGSSMQLNVAIIVADHDEFFVPIDWDTKDFIDKLQTLAKTEHEAYEKHCHAWASQNAFENTSTMFGGDCE